MWTARTESYAKLMNKFIVGMCFFWIYITTLCGILVSYSVLYTVFPKQCGNTWGSYGSGKKPGWLDRGGGRGSVQNSSLFSCFRACMFVSSVNFRSFRVAATDGSGFCL